MHFVPTAEILQSNQIAENANDILTTSSENNIDFIICQNLSNVCMVREAVDCKKGMVVLTEFDYFSFLLSACIKHSGVPLAALNSKQIKNLIWLSRTLVNVMGEYFANEVVQSCGKRQR